MPKLLRIEKSRLQTYEQAAKNSQAVQVFQEVQGPPDILEPPVVLLVQAPLLHLRLFLESQGVLEGQLDLVPLVHLFVL